MTFQDAVQARYGSADATIYLHSSVAASRSFNDLIESVESRSSDCRLFAAGLVEAENYCLFDNPAITANVNTLKQLVASGKLEISPHHEYDLTRYNRRVSVAGERLLVVYGSQKAYVDFAVHCDEREPIDVVLLTKVNGNYIIADSNRVRSVMLKSAYNAKWNASPYTYGDKLQKGTILRYGEKREIFTLGENISILTGEGEVYRTSMKGYLCKIYKKGVLQRGLTDKLLYVVGRNKMTNRAAWPLSVVYNRIDQPIGFLMRAVEGESLSNLMYSWNDSEWLERVCRAGLQISQTIALFHSQGIVVGDISPKDILFDKRMNITFIDADSFQYDEYPCPGMMYEYKYKDLEPRLLKTRLRPFLFEYFSLAVVLFEMFTAGHFPNETKQSLDEIQFGDDNSNDNRMFDYKHMRFSLAVNGSSGNVSDSLIRCWQRIPERFRQLFVDVFTYSRIVSAGEWQSAFIEQLGAKTSPSTQSSKKISLFRRGNN